MTPVGKKRVRKPRVAAPVELPQTPEEMDSLLKKGRLNGEEAEEMINPPAYDGYIDAMSDEERAEQAKIQATAVTTTNVPFDPCDMPLRVNLPSKFTQPPDTIFEIKDSDTITFLPSDVSQHAIWYNIFRYLFAKSRNIGGELHLGRPFVRRIQTLLGKQWADMTQVDKDFILGMMKEMPK